MNRALKTQTACLQAVLEVFRESIGNRPFTMGDASAWAMSKGLYPTPKRGDRPALFAEFAERLESVRAEGCDAK